MVGSAELVERLRRHPLQRRCRADKLTLAALEGTLALYLEPERALREVPVLRMALEDADAVRGRAVRLAELVGGEVEETVGRIGGGALPLAELPSFACAVEEELAAPLRAGEPPVVGVVRDGRLLLDCRTLSDAEAEEVAAAVDAGPRMSDRAPEAELWDAASRCARRRARSRSSPTSASPRSSPTARAPWPSSPARVGADPDTLHRLLRALASDGVFAEEEPGVFRNTEASEQLRGRGWADVRAPLRRRLAPGRGRAGRRPARRRSPQHFGTDFWSWLAAQPRRARALRPRDGAGQGAATSSGSPSSSGAATRRSSTSAAATAPCSSALLERQPGLRGIVFDLPETVRDEAALGDRIGFVDGSFFERVPEGDVYILSTILHDWDDESAAAILRTIRAAAPADARLIIIEAVVPAGQRAGRREVARPADARALRAAASGTRRSGASCSRSTASSR